MILTCPSCGTRYQTDRARIAPPGCDVRCAKCETVWFQAASEGELEFEPDALDTDEPALRSGSADSVPEKHSRRAPRKAGGMNWALAAGWLILLAALAGFVWAGIAYRNEIAKVWPQSATLYALIDMPVNTRGLAFAELMPQKLFEPEGEVLQISGRVVNIADRELPVPEIYVSLRDVEERELYGWTFNTGANILAPGQSQAFTTRLPNPPHESRRADIRFADDTAR